MADPFVTQRYYTLALDPVHVGTGGYRLGRVDNTIMREPGTNLPKIPGSSIAGVTRAFTAMAIQSENPMIPRKMKYQRPGKKVKVQKGDGTEEEKIIYYSCAGKGIDDGEGHCGETDCPVCISFGFSKKNSSFQGLAQFTDARILFFPVHSMIGPVWITCPMILMEHEIIAPIAESSFRQICGMDAGDRLNFGWLMLGKDSNTETIDLAPFKNGAGFEKPLEIAKDKLFLVPDRLFSQIVNDNLEVRTSVAIDPFTGAAEEGALYTYEAIPRATVMWFDIIYNKPEFFRVPTITGFDAINHGKEDGKGHEWVQEHVEKGLRYLESLGVGGMNTRGMGRLRVCSREARL